MFIAHILKNERGRIMKRKLSLVMVSVLVFGLFAGASFAAELKLGKAEYAAHGTKCFTIAVVALEGDKIVAAYLDEYQMLPKDQATGVPNSSADFGQAFANPEQVLASKRVNNDYYSNNMTRAGSTQSLVKSWSAIESFVVGKTISELEAIVTATDKADMVDTVSGATLVDTKGYVEALLLAAYDALSN